MNNKLTAGKIIGYFALMAIGVGGFSVVAMAPASNFAPLVNDSQTAPSPIQPPAAAPGTALNAPANTNQSLNWSGYVSTYGTYTGVGATWIVPIVINSANYSADATWVGIGGSGSRDLIQAGTQAIVDLNGNISYAAWFETLPGTSRPVSLAVKPGDSVSVALTDLGDNSWNISITDNTNGHNFQTTQQYDSSLSSAEWVEEMVTSRAGFVPLDNFGAVQFTNGWTIVNGNRLAIGQTSPQTISMITQNGQTLAAPSAIGSDNSSFTVSRTDTSSAVSSAPAVRFVSYVVRRRHVTFRFFNGGRN